MALRTNPSERQRRLGAELRKLRTGAGLSGDAAGALLDADRTRISHIEAGRMDVPRNGLYRLLRSYRCPDGPLFEGLMDMAHDRGKGWWDEYVDVLGRRARDLAETEFRATGIRIHEPLFIPGMFQTESYARAVIQSVEQDVEHIDRYVGFRMGRQRVLTHDRLTSYHAVIHESALRVQIGSPKVMRKQLLRLIEVTRLPNVTVQIFPFEMGAYSVFSRPFMLFGGSTRELDTLYQEQPRSASFSGEVERIAEYDRMFDRLAALAFDPIDPHAAPEAQETRDSLSLIQHVLHELG
ncbi:helix-turn-helix domain-containing protein [Streptomyces pathocidini]|uniref:Helix-turn-helix domain-containing protein n=1 Tax=Streptomyces pathocidini TaxID=1650571 RepID=A0ABW7UST1_9ACTN|nr:helix-turn-helix transcriptional regulator [Streptomyces pathocidini]